MSLRDNVLKQKVCDMFQEIGVGICDRHIQACHPLKDKDSAILKFTNRKDCLWILRVKRQLIGLDPSGVDLPEGTKNFANESLCPYYQGIWNKCKKLRDKQKLYQYYIEIDIEIDSIFFLYICSWSSCCVIFFGKFCEFLSHISTLFFFFTFSAILEF